RAKGGFASPERAGARGTKASVASDVPRSNSQALPARSERGFRGTQASAASDVPLIKQIDPPVVHGRAVVVLRRRAVAREALIEVRGAVATAVVLGRTIR